MVCFKVLPQLRQFERSKGVNVELDGFHEYPKCYRTIDIDPCESIFLEDLTKRSFTMIDRSTGTVTAKHVQLVMQSLAKFHAVSFAMKDQQSTKFEELASNLTEVLFSRDNDNLKTYFNKAAQHTLDSVSNEGDAQLLARAKRFFERDALDLVMDCMDSNVSGLVCVITHGDNWQNNQMFSSCANDESGTPDEICMLDWQVSRIASPVLDILYFIFSCTTKELRDAHYDDFLKTYHNTLAAHIRR